MAAYAVITIVPILILIWYWTMYSGIDRGAITGAGASGGA
jgi:bacteriorhodopsin